MDKPRCKDNLGKNNFWTWREKYLLEPPDEQRENFIKWLRDSVKCPMFGYAPHVKPFCKVGGYRHGGFMDCEYDTCFARFAKNISG